MNFTSMSTKDIIKGLSNTSLSPMKTEKQNFEVKVSFIRQFKVKPKVDRCILSILT